MILILGGFIGSGRKMLAHELALREGFHHYAMDEHKLTKFREKNGEVIERKMSFRTDPMRRMAYKRAIRDMERLIKMHNNIVIEDSFHRKGPREYFFQAIQRFHPVDFIWIECDESSVTKRLQKMKKKGLIGSVRRCLERRERAIAQFEPFDVPPPTFHIAAQEKDIRKRFLEMIVAVKNEALTLAS